MVDITPISNKTIETISDLINLLKNEPDGLYRIFLLNGKMYQAIKSKGEVTTLVNTRGDVFRRAFTHTTNTANTYVAPEWVEVDKLKDINTFLLIAQVKGWI